MGKVNDFKETDAYNDHYEMSYMKSKHSPEKYAFLKSTYFKKIRTFTYISNGTTGGGWGGWLQR